MKLIVLWSLFIGYCLGGIVALSIDQISGKWGNVLVYAAVFVPGVLLSIYTERVRYPKATNKLTRRKRQVKVVNARKTANSR